MHTFPVYTEYYVVQTKNNKNKQIKTGRISIVNKYGFVCKHTPCTYTTGGTYEKVLPWKNACMLLTPSTCVQHLLLFFF